MQDPRLVQMADVIINYSIALQPGEKILIQGPTLGAPLMRELYRTAIRAGGLVSTHVLLPGLEKIYFDEANERQLMYPPPFFELLLDDFDAYVSYWASSNSREGTHFDQKKRKLRAQALQPFQQRHLEQIASGELRWCGTLYPTNAHAQDADMALEEYEEFVFNACLPDRQDPIGFWKAMQARQDKIVAFLDQVSTIRLVSEDTDLTAVVEGRTWNNDSGHLNYPGGEVYTGPVETGTTGYIRFGYPSIYRGNEVADVRLWFEKGQVVRATAGKGIDFLTAMLDQDEGSRILGELAIGTNPGISEFTGHTLFDEKIYGTVHMALGASIPSTGGKNHSAIHWDLVCDMRSGGQIYADDQLIYEDGEFVIEFE